MLRSIFCLLILSSMISCDDCRDVACTTPPSEFRFQLVSTSTGEDLFKDTTFVRDNVAITRLNIDKKQDITYTVDSGLTYFVCQDIGWEVGEDNKRYTLSVGNDKQYQFTYLTEEKSIECCLLLGDLVEFSSDNFIINESDFGFRISI